MLPEVKMFGVIKGKGGWCLFDNVLQDDKIGIWIDRFIIVNQLSSVKH